MHPLSGNGQNADFGTAALHTPGRALLPSLGRMPHSMGHFNVGNIAVCAGKPSALADITAAFEVVHFARYERIGGAGGLHFQVYNRRTWAANAEPAHRAILGKVPRVKRNLSGHAGSERI